jgi:predicted lipid carrier protein YhbT
VAISKDEQYTTYMLGDADGKALVAKSKYAKDDLLDLATRKLSPGASKRILSSGHDELSLLVKNYMDGLEDGIKAQVQRESSKYRKWMDDNLT